MDKRVQKSKSCIINTFLEIRAKKPLEKITVTELCKKAEINKSTFYVHYHDIYDLSEQLEKEVVDSILESIQHPEKVFETPDQFTRDLYQAYQAKNSLIQILFADTRSMLLPQKITGAIKDLLFRMRPEYRENPEMDICFTYQIYGGYYAFKESHQYDSAYAVSVISSLSAGYLALKKANLPEDSQRS